MLTVSQAMGPALRLLRARRGLRQYQVADKAGITKAMLSSYEIAGVKPSLHSLTSILNALETDLAEFQQAIDIITGRVDPEELKKQESPDDAQQMDPGDKVLQVLVPRLGAILPLLDRIATALEGIAEPAPDKAPPQERRMRQTEGSRPHPRPE